MSAACTDGAFAGETPAPVFLITSTNISPAGREDTQELMSITNSSAGSTLYLRDPRGTTLSMPVNVGPSGAVLVQTDDPAVACYDAAINVVAGSTAGNTAVAFAYGGATVEIPIALAASDRSDGTRAIVARSNADVSEVSDPAAGPLAFQISGAVDLRQNDVLAAQFVETTSLRSSGTIVGEAQCSVMRLAAAS